MAITAGLDVGGAHLKVAVVEGAGVRDARQFVCPLWQGLDKLDTALAAASELTARASRVAITMTGELSDLFSDRRTGVETLVTRLGAAFGSRASYWMAPGSFASADVAIANAASVGSVNFLATAALVAGYHADAILIDMGSTTTDIIPIRGGRPVPRGLTDRERQATGELVYTGLTRTAVMGIMDRAPFKGRWVTTAREYLATMADVRRVLGDPLSGIDLHATADGRGKSLWESVARLSRMLGCDGSEASLDEWRVVARFIVQEQRRSIEDGLYLVLSNAPPPSHAPAVVAGIGAGEAALIAERASLPAIPLCQLIGATGALATAVNHNAPAVAVALLLDTSQTVS